MRWQVIFDLHLISPAQTDALHNHVKQDNGTSGQRVGSRIKHPEDEPSWLKECSLVPLSTNVLHHSKTFLKKTFYKANSEVEQAGNFLVKSFSTGE